MTMQTRSVVAHSSSISTRMAVTRRRKGGLVGTDANLAGAHALAVMSGPAEDGQSFGPRTREPLGPLLRSAPPRRLSSSWALSRSSAFQTRRRSLPMRVRMAAFG